MVTRWTGAASKNVPGGSGTRRRRRGGRASRGRASTPRRSPPRRPSAQPHRAPDPGGEPRLDVRLVGHQDLAVGQGDPGGREGSGVTGRLGVLGPEVEQARPASGVLGAGHLAGLRVDQGVRPVAEQAAFGHIGCVQLLAQHRLERVAPDREHPARHGLPRLTMFVSLLARRACGQDGADPFGAVARHIRPTVGPVGVGFRIPETGVGSRPDCGVIPALAPPPTDHQARLRRPPATPRRRSSCRAWRRRWPALRPCPPRP